jgi:hypothetical protein
MYISARQARALLIREGVSAWSAQRVLASGLAGEPVRLASTNSSRSSVLYEEDRVTELVQRPSMHWPELDQHCPAGYFVSRRSFPATAPRADQLAALSGGWSGVCMWTWIVMSIQIDSCGYLPFVATVGGLVVLGADIVKARGLSELVLAPPGPWFDAVAGHWLPTGPGRPWVLTLGPMKVADELSPDAA